jgi:hypothetical protein
VTSLAEFAASTSPLPPSPKGWEPQVEIKGDSGHAVVQQPAPGAKETELLVEAGFDTSEYRIKGDVAYRKWMRYDREWLHYYKFDVERITEESPAERKADIDAIIKSMLRGTPKHAQLPASDDALVAVLSDWQIGKNSAHTVEGVKRSIKALVAHLKTLRRNGRKLDTLALLCTGDLFEGCDGHYAMQTFTVDLDRRGQSRVVRRLFVWIVKELAPLVNNLIVTAVGGNHGENRKDGKAYTSFADNDDVAVIEVAAEIFAGRPGYEHVTFHVAEDQLSACIDIKGVPVGLTHGHLAGRGGTLPQNKQKQWWGDQWWDENSPAPRAKILVTSHYHHLTVSNWGTRTHIQSPAYDGGSKWFGDVSGMNSPDGLLTFVVDPQHPLGWDELRVL